MTSFKRWGGRLSIVALGAAMVLASMPSDADARRGFGGFGSRGAKTYQAPPKTNTAPKAAEPALAAQMNAYTRQKRSFGSVKPSSAEGKAVTKAGAVVDLDNLNRASKF